MNSEEIICPKVQFDEIAFLYDELMSGVPYSAWMNYLQMVLKHHKFKPATVLDLCCGTGSMSLLFAKKGYQVSGVDISVEMIEAARKKAAEEKLYVDFHVSSASEFRLGKRFDLIVSVFDSLNYIVNSADLQQAFYRVADHMKSGGLFVFDMNTELALAGRLFDQNNRGSRSSVIYDWRSSYCNDSKLCTVRMSFLHKKDNRKIEITHFQRAYFEEEIREMLTNAGLEVLEIYNAYTLKKASNSSDRVFYVARL